MMPLKKLTPGQFATSSALVRTCDNCRLSTYNNPDASLSSNPLSLLLAKSRICCKPKNRKKDQSIISITVALLMPPPLSMNGGHGKFDNRRLTLNKLALVPMTNPA